VRRLTTFLIKVVLTDSVTFALFLDTKLGETLQNSVWLQGFGILRTLLRERLLVGKTDETRDKSVSLQRWIHAR